MKQIKFAPTISPKQGSGPKVVCFAASPDQIAAIARVERIGRDHNGALTGFQRPQIAAHIREIRDYLSNPDTMLPNAIVLAFSYGATIGRHREFSVDISKGAPGWVVDGQQRLMAALGVEGRRFELLVSAFLCPDPNELNRQFILINNTRPLAKPLIYELLPNVSGLPERLSDRTGAAILTEALNYHAGSSLRGIIHQQTNPDGVIKDTIVQKLLINSLQHGALRGIESRPDLMGKGFRLVNEFFWAVRDVFRDDWELHTPKTSRLLHGAGLVAMGYIMDELVVRDGAHKRSEFVKGLKPLVGKTCWTSGTWDFDSEKRPWSSLQNTKPDYRLVSHHLVRLVRRRVGR
ncbi:MAG TPA: DGQHR domain-containing protein DpdB [Rhizomicrobium sp.]|jgi:DGQHR domain-containing protein